MIKAIAGGGGRGIRAVHCVEELETAYKSCQAEAQTFFGNGDVYAEQLVRKARHIEVQVVGDSSGNVSHLWERECTLQRRNQKLVEIAPSPTLDEELREQLLDASVKMAAEAGYDNIGTFEFLVDIEAAADEQRFAFMEANPRLQVEHTVTEEVTGIDLVKTQLQIAAGKTLADLGVDNESRPAAVGHAIQVRINMETMREDGSTRPSGGLLQVFEVPTGPGVRTDTFGYAGYKTSHSYDSLLAKVIGYSNSPSFDDAVIRTYRGLAEFKIVGVKTNIPLLQNILQHADFAAGNTYTQFVEEHIAELVPKEGRDHRALFFDDVPETQ